MNTRVHQLLHGYRRGHQLLASSVRLESKDADLIARLSDLSGFLTADANIQPYLTAYPLPNGKFYALARTWLDTNAPRAGCVITHTLLIPIRDWGKSPEPYGFAGLFASPSGTDDVERYQVALEYDDSRSSQAASLRSPSQEPATEFVAKYFGEGVRPFVWFDEQHPEDVFWMLLSGIWPALRRQFACCTFSLQPRVLDDRPFDLMFAPSSVSSRFHSIPRENLLGASSQTNHVRSLGESEERWIRDWANAIFGGHDTTNTIAEELAEFGSQLGKDPTSVRKLFLIRDLRRRATASPTAAVGLMDMVEALAPEAAQAWDYKVDVVAQSLQAAARVSEPNEALKSYFSISERLGHDAFSRVGSQTAPKLSSIVAAWASKHPEVALEVGKHLFVPGPRDSESAFAKGIVDGFRKLASVAPEQLAVLRHFPVAAPSIIAEEPGIALGFLRGMRAHESGSSAADDLAVWIASLVDLDVRTRIRELMLPAIKSDDEASIAEELLRHLPEGDVSDALDTLSQSTCGFSCPRIRQIVSEQVGRVYPHCICEWANQTSAWSRDIAELIAMSYTSDEDGFNKLLSSPLSDPRHEAQILSAYLEIAVTPQVPSWFREYARRSSNFLVPLLALGSSTPPDVSNTIQKILSEVRETPIAKEVDLVSKVGDFHGYPFGSALVDLGMRSAVGGFIAGDIDWKICEMWHSSNWGLKWLENATIWELESLLTRKCEDSNAWSRTWEWVVSAPESLYRRSPPVLPKLVESIVSTRRWAWDDAITKSWIKILQRASHEAESSTYLDLCADALYFAFKHERYPVGGLAAESFWTVYTAVTKSSDTPRGISSLFGLFDWDKGKELREKLVNSFLNSTWPPGDLALAVRDQSLLRKIFKRLMRRWDGEKYIKAMLKDLAGREDPGAARMFADLEKLTQNPDFYEPWD